MINKHKSNKIKENSNTVRHLNNGTDHRHSKSCCDQSSPARRTINQTRLPYNPRADYRFAPSQCETSLQSNAVSHWLGTNIDSAPNPGGCRTVCEDLWLAGDVACRLADPSIDWETPHTELWVRCYYTRTWPTGISTGHLCARLMTSQF